MAGSDAPVIRIRKRRHYRAVYANIGQDVSSVLPNRSGTENADETGHFLLISSLGDNRNSQVSHVVTFLATMLMILNFFLDTRIT